VKLDGESGETVLSLDHFTSGDIGPLTFDLRTREIVGLVGLRGAGHEVISRALFGLAPHSGRVRLKGEEPDLRSPKSAMASGIGLVAKDRTEESIAMNLSIRENTFLNPATLGRRLLNILGTKAEADQAEQIGESLGLSPNAPELAIEALSGGNQQKVVIGRWLATNRTLLICEDPTAGVDVGAKAEIYALLNKALEAGLGILLISTDFEEISAICHRAQRTRTHQSRTCGLDPRAEGPAIPANLWPGHPDGLPDSALFGAVAGHLPNALERARHHFGQGDHRPVEPGCNDTDGRRPH